MRRPAVLLPFLPAVVVAAASLLLGAVPLIVEIDGLPEPIHCGPALYRGADLPQACSTAADVWRVVAQAGLGLACVLLVGAVLLAVRPGGRRTVSSG